MMRICIVGFLCAISFISTAQYNFEKAFQDLLLDYASNGKIDYAGLFDQKDKLKDINVSLKEVAIDSLTGNEKKSTAINVYNYLVIREIIEHYPVQSVKQIAGFFTNKHSFKDASYSLDEIENQLRGTNDPRIHFALVCGAHGCPDLSENIFTTENIESELDAITKKSLARPDIVSEKEGSLNITQIFKWFKSDFDEDGGIINFIKKHKSIDATNYAFIGYDWSLNQIKANEATEISRYFASRLYSKKQFEINFFNNYYTQKDENELGEAVSRYDFFNSLIQVTYGWSDKLNLGLDFKFRSVYQNLEDPSLNFKGLAFKNNNFEDAPGYTRSGLTSVGLRAKYHPLKSSSRITGQSSLILPLLFDEANKGFLDWTGVGLQQQFFYDREFKNKYSFFLETGLLLENINSSLFGKKDGFNQLNFNSTIIISYFPDSKWTFYGLYGISPQMFFQTNNMVQTRSYGAFYQVGAGAKYFINKQIQIELLYTSFHANVEGRQAQTFNFGLRYYKY